MFLLQILTFHAHFFFADPTKHELSEMSYTEAREPIAQAVILNSHKDIILDKLYIFLFFVILVVFWIFCLFIKA